MSSRKGNFVGLVVAGGCGAPRGGTRPARGIDILGWAAQGGARASLHPGLSSGILAGVSVGRASVWGGFWRARFRAWFEAMDDKRRHGAVVIVSSLPCLCGKVYLAKVSDRL